MNSSAVRRCLILYSSLFRNFRISRQKRRGYGRDAKRNALIITFRLLRSLAYPAKCFSILARTQLRAAKRKSRANFIYIYIYVYRHPAYRRYRRLLLPRFLYSQVCVLFAKESTLSRYFHRTACENVKFILLPSPYYTRYRCTSRLPTFRDRVRIRTDRAQPGRGRRGEPIERQIRTRMLARYISKGLLHIIFPSPREKTRRATRIKIGINR